MASTLEQDLRSVRGRLEMLVDKADSAKVRVCIRTAASQITLALDAQEAHADKSLVKRLKANPS